MSVSHQLLECKNQHSGKSKILGEKNILYCSSNSLWGGLIFIWFLKSITAKAFPVNTFYLFIFKNYFYFCSLLYCFCTGRNLNSNSMLKKNCDVPYFLDVHPVILLTYWLILRYMVTLKFGDQFSPLTNYYLWLLPQQTPILLIINS